MPLGIVTNCGIVVLGGLLGSVFGKQIPQRIRDYLSRLFGITSIAIGITLIVKTSQLSAVLLSVLLGAAIGEGIRLEEKFGALSSRLQRLGRRFAKGELSGGSVQTARLMSVLILICTGSTGLMGAMQEGLTGDSSVLMAKSVLDLFGSVIFASTLGLAVAFIAIPQFIVYIVLFFLGRFIIPVTSPQMIADFLGCGGIIAFTTGLRIAEIQPIRVSSLLPALVLVMPLSWLWAAIIG